MISKNTPLGRAVISNTPYPMQNLKKIYRFLALLATFRGLHSQKYAFLPMVLNIKNDQLTMGYVNVPLIFLPN